MKTNENQKAPYPYEKWHGKPYYSLDAYCKNTYGEKLYKTALNAGLTCPNRDGTLGNRGCIFCSAGGSGDFASVITAGTGNAGESSLLSSAIAGSSDASGFKNAYQESRKALSNKKAGRKFIAYFQAYTNTYGPVPYLEKLYRLALEEPTVAGISIATRPDCLPPEIMALLCRLKEEYAPKFIWLELGLQTIYEDSAAFIRRGYPLSCFEEAVLSLHEAGFPVITHMILGLPGEDKDKILSSMDYLNKQPVWGIKLQLLHILKGTDLGVLYEKEPDKYSSFPSLLLYLDTLISCLERLRPDMVIHRVTGDAPKRLLLAPLWSANKRLVLNTLHREMNIQGSFQGRNFIKEVTHARPFNSL